MPSFYYNHKQIIKRFLKKIAKNDIETNFILTHKKVRFLAYEIRNSWHDKKLSYGQWETNQDISFWLDRLCEYGICHRQRSRIADHLLQLLEKASAEEPEEENVFDLSDSEF